eukprot:jgi/Chlat1/6279/Chrsp44S05868
MEAGGGGVGAPVVAVVSWLRRVLAPVSRPRFGGDGRRRRRWRLRKCWDVAGTTAAGARELQQATTQACRYRRTFHATHESACFHPSHHKVRCQISTAAANKDSAHGPTAEEALDGGFDDDMLVYELLCGPDIRDTFYRACSDMLAITDKVKSAKRQRQLRQLLLQQPPPRYAEGTADAHRYTGFAVPFEEEVFRAMRKVREGWLGVVEGSLGLTLSVISMVYGFEYHRPEVAIVPLLLFILQLWFRLVDVQKVLQSLADLTQEVAEESTFSDFLDATTDIFVLYTRDLRVCFINETGARLLKREVEDVLGRTNSTLLGKQAAVQVDSCVREAFRSKEKVFVVHEVMNEELGEKWLYDSVYTPYLTRTGQAAAVVGICRNVTSGKQKIKELEAANEAKNNLLLNFNQEIREPLNHILSATQVLKDTELSDEQREFCNIVQKSAESLLSLISDILDHRAIETGQLRLETDEFNLQELVEDCVDTFASKAFIKGVEVACLVHPSIPPFLLGDSGRLRQILSNLLSNAVKFTSTGWIVCRVCEARPRENNVVHLRLEVQDTGIGIRTEDLQRLFNRFEQVDRSSSRRFEGIGLGLAICNQLAELMGGRMGVESKFGEGSTFYLCVTLSVASSAPQTLPLPALPASVVFKTVAHNPDGSDTHTSKRPQVAVVHASRAIADVFATYLVSAGYHSSVYSSMNEFLSHRKNRRMRFAAAVLDLPSLKDDKQKAALRKFGIQLRRRDDGPTGTSLVLTVALPTVQLKQEVLTWGEGWQVISKPVRKHRLLQAVAGADYNAVQVTSNTTPYSDPACTGPVPDTDIVHDQNQLEPTHVEM